MRAAEWRPAARKAALALVLPDRPVVAAIVAARLLRVVGAAVVAGKLAHDVVAVGLFTRADDLLPLRLELGDPAVRLLALLGEVDATPRAPQGLGEQEVLVAVVAFEIELALLVGVLDLPQLRLDGGRRSRVWLERLPSWTRRCSSCKQMGFFVDQLTGGAACNGGSWAPGARAAGGCIAGGSPCGGGGGSR